MSYETVQGNGSRVLAVQHAPRDQRGLAEHQRALCLGGQYPKVACLSAELDVFEGFGRIFYGGYAPTIASAERCIANRLRRTTGRTTVEQLGPARHRHGDLYGLAFLRRPLDSRPRSVCYIDGQLAGLVSARVRLDTISRMHLLFYNWRTGWEDEERDQRKHGAELDVFVDWVASGRIRRRSG